MMSDLRKRAIIIDDDRLLRTSLIDMLEGWGYEVISCAEPVFYSVFLDRGCDCRAEHVCADIIITDVNMPHMTGLDFIDKQKHKGCKVSNIAVMSGAWDDEKIEYAERLGCTVFDKPFQIDKLKKWIRACEKKIEPQRVLSDLPICIK